MNFPTPDNEHERLRVLDDLGVLDSKPDPVLDEICSRAAHTFGVPIALISFVASDRQWFKARTGLGCVETPRDQSFCSHAIMKDRPMVVADALQDSRFKTNPLVLGVPHIRFYAGAPLFYGDAIRLGTLCIIDTKPRLPADFDLELLEQMADEVAGELWVHHHASTGMSGAPP